MKMKTNQVTLPWHVHVPMLVFTAATIALTIMDHRSMAIYFSVLTFFAFIGSCAASTRNSDQNNKEESK